jgi:NDP-sugar pyrophosphorylase family protein
MKGEFRHALIMAAGRGMRMSPLTNTIPKPMMPLGDSTLILRGINTICRNIPFLHITVGYKARMLAEHIIDEGIASILCTEGKGNAWWIFNTLLAYLDEPLVVLTCDNLVDLDLKKLYADYHDFGAPACMVVPVHPVQGLEGDYIFQQEHVVTALDRNRPAAFYCSGIQVLNPKQITELVAPTDDFGDAWKQLIGQRQLYCSRVIPERWFTIDTVETLAVARDLNKDPTWSEFLNRSRIRGPVQDYK